MDEIAKNSVLLVEDGPDYALITKRVWKKECDKNTLHVVNDGEQALRFLHKEEEYVDALPPCLLLLDLKMPGMDGFEVLEKIKGDDELKSIPVIVLTSSERSEDIERAYKLGCNSYIVKPRIFENVLKAIIEIKRYWLTTCKVPRYVT